ncbi:MAG TPA: hypothetical protein VH092_19650 [Urbifossiella sp.]|jgi:hypothetical protein|nr:hypothetical protein [Urbifossiella sp.]
MDPSIEQILREFVAKRIDFIRTGSRQDLDGTYLLANRNEYNWHDYNWYMCLIEFGFGGDVQKFEISAVTRETPIPFAGLVAYPWPPEYLVSLTTVSQRRTVWLVSIYEGAPKVIMPAFNGRIGDAIACGDFGQRDSRRSIGTSPVFRFDVDQFAHELAERIGLELNLVHLPLRYDEIRALAIDCFPWFGEISLCILTGREEFSDEQSGKWSIGEWRYHDFPSTPGERWPYAKDLIEQMKAFYAGGPEEGRNLRADTIYRACAKALLSPAVSRALDRYGFRLAKDFEFGVFDPDHPEKGNYCLSCGS